MTLHPLFLKWSNNIDISIDDIRLRNKDWVELVPMLGAPDVDAISAKFFVAKGKSRALQFQSKGRADLYLELQVEKYLEIMTHLESGDNHESESESPSVQPVKRLVRCNTPLVYTDLSS